MKFFKVLCLAMVLAAVFTGCSTNPGSSTGGGPTVSGYISTGAQKQF